MSVLGNGSACISLWFHYRYTTMLRYTNEKLFCLSTVLNLEMSFKTPTNVVYPLPIPEEASEAVFFLHYLQGVCVCYSYYRT